MQSLAICQAPTCLGFASSPRSKIQNAKQIRFAKPARRSQVAPKAFMNPSVIATIADAAPGSVDAPLPVVAGLAVLVSLGALLFFTFGLKPGTDAAIDMQQRDKKSGRFRR